MWQIRSNHLIRQIVLSTGAVTTLAGTGSSGSANGTGTSASFNYPYEGLLQMEQTYMWQIISNHLIRKIVISTGVVTTVAGTGSSGSANGTGTSASFSTSLRDYYRWNKPICGRIWNDHLIRKIE